VDCSVDKTVQLGPSVGSKIESAAADKLVAFSEHDIAKNHTLNKPPY